MEKVMVAVQKMDQHNSTGSDKKAFKPAAAVLQSNDSSYVMYDYGHSALGMKRRSTPCRLYNLMILTILISTCAICACVYASISIIKQEVLTELMASQELQEKHDSGGNLAYNSDPTQSGGGLSFVHKRSARRCRRRRRDREGRRRQRSTSDPHRRRHRHQQKSHTHLLVASGNFTIPQHGRHYFIWSEGDHSLTVHLVYTRTSLRAHPNDIIGIQVKQSGHYEIYSQVVIRGLTSHRYPYYCAQSIVVIRNNRVHKVLLKSFLTQGDSPSGYSLNGEPLSHRDSVNQYGVFHLDMDDEVRVSFDNTCGHVNFSNSDKRAFYFGLNKK